MARTYTFTRVEGLRAAIRALPKEASATLRDANQRIADDVARKAASAAMAVGGVAKYVAPTLRSRRDREAPKVLMGGAKRLPTSGSGWSRARKGDRQTVGDVVWGAEFGSDRSRQFSPWRGNDTGAGYFLWPTVRAEQDAIADAFIAAVGEAIDSAARRTDG